MSSSFYLVYLSVHKSIPFHSLLVYNKALNLTKSAGVLVLPDDKDVPVIVDAALYVEELVVFALAVVLPELGLGLEQPALVEDDFPDLDLVLNGEATLVAGAQHGFVATLLKPLVAHGLLVVDLVHPVADDLAPRQQYLPVLHYLGFLYHAPFLPLLPLLPLAVAEYLYFDAVLFVELQVFHHLEVVKRQVFLKAVREHEAMPLALHVLLQIDRRGEVLPLILAV